MYYYRATCNTCGFDGKWSDFKIGRDGFQHLYVAGCKKCGALKGPYVFDPFEAALGNKNKFTVYADEEYHYAVERNYIICALSRGLRISYREVRYRRRSDNYYRYEIWDNTPNTNAIVHPDHVKRLEAEGVIEKHAERYRKSSRSRDWSYYVYYELKDRDSIVKIPCGKCKHFIKIYRKRGGVCNLNNRERRKDDTCGLRESGMPERD